MTREIESQERQETFKALMRLEKEGLCDEVSLTLTDPEMPYVQWESLGRFLGSVDRRSRWYIGDWLNFGEAVFGEQASQGIDATTSDRYNEAERVTGLDVGTLMNIRSVCGKVPKRNRRPELGFWIHAEVAKLDVDEQPRWLDLAVENSLTKNELRDSIRLEKKGGGDAASLGAGEGDGVSAAQRIEEAARLVWVESQDNGDGEFLVPSGAMRQLAAALGEE